MSYVDPNRNEWYQKINPKEHIYTPGYGFSPRPPALLERQHIRNTANAAAGCLLGYFALATLLPRWFYALATTLLAPFLSLDVLSEGLKQIAQGVGMLCALAVPFALYIQAVGILRSSALPTKRVSVRLAVAAVLISLAVSVIGRMMIVLCEGSFAALGVEFCPMMEQQPSAPVAMALYLVNATLLPAVLEEFAFRGALMQSLRRFGDGFALLVSSLLFAVVHLHPLSIPNALLMGLVIGYFVLFTGSVWIGVIIHFVHNAVLMLTLGLSYLLAEPTYTVAVLSMELFFLLAGLAAVVFLLRRYGGLFSLRPAVTVNSGSGKLVAFFSTVPMVILLVLAVLLGANYLAR
ncbi:MAG: type II CAAX endopeptidase family protein [Oscillospiraceae bacterium]